MLAKYLADLKVQKNLSWNDIANLSNVPVQTVRNIFSGETSNPGFASVAAIVKAMGGSLDELADIPREGVERSDFEAMTERYEDRIVQITDHYERQIAQIIESNERRIQEINDREIQRTREAIEREKREGWKQIALMGLVLALIGVIFYLVLDALHGNWGIFRYQEALEAMRGASAPNLGGWSVRL